MYSSCRKCKLFDGKAYCKVYGELKLVMSNDRCDNFDPVCRSSNPGSAWKYRYSYAITDKGIEAVVAGKINLYDFIQSFSDSVNINSIIRRYKEGDLNALMEGGEGSYGNFVGLPTSMNEVMKVVQAYERVYNSLADDVRENFTDFGDFVRSIASVSPDAIADIRGKRRSASVVSDGSDTDK